MREVGVHKARSVNGSAGGCAQFSRLALARSTRIKPVLNGMDLRWRGAAGIPRDRTGFIGIADLVRALVITSVVGEENAGLIGAIHNKQRES